MRYTTLILFFLLLSAALSAQTSGWRKNYQYTQAYGHKSDSLLILPKILTDPSLVEDGAVRYNTMTGLIQLRKNGNWVDISEGSKALDSLRYDPSTSIFYGRYTTGGELAVPTGLLDTINKRPFKQPNNYTFAGWDISYAKDTANAQEGVIMNLGGDTLLNIFRISLTGGHSGNDGKVVKRYSNDAGVTWSAISDVYNSVYDDRNIAGGMVGSRVVIFLRQYDAAGNTTVSIGFMYSDDRGATWSSYTTISPIQLNATTTPYGDIVRANGKWLKPIQADYITELFQSTDGATWTSMGAMWDYRVSLTRKTSETAIAYVGQDSLIAFARDNVNPGGLSPYQFKSVDNGSSWSYVGRLPYDSFIPSVDVKFDTLRNNIILVGGERKEPYATNRLLLFAANKNVLSDTSKWILTSAINRPSPNNWPFYGYPTMTPLVNGSFALIFSDRRQKFSDTAFVVAGEIASLYHGRVQWLSNSDKPDVVFPGNAITTNKLTGYYVAQKDNSPFTYDSSSNAITSRFPAPLALYGIKSNDSIPVLDIRNSTNGHIATFYGGRRYDYTVADFNGYVTGITPGSADSSNKYATTALLRRAGVINQNNAPQGASFWIAGSGRADRFIGNKYNSGLSAGKTELAGGSDGPTSYLGAEIILNGSLSNLGIMQFMAGNYTGIVNPERARMDSSGNWGFGTTTTNVYKVDVNGRFHAQRVYADSLHSTFLFSNSSAGVVTLIGGATGVTSMRGGQIDLSGGAASITPGSVDIRAGTGNAGAVQPVVVHIDAAGYAQFTGAINLPMRATSISTTLTATDYTLRVTVSGTTVTLPAASANAGRVYEVVNESAGSITISSVQVFGTGTTILPASTSWRIQSDGTNWRLLSRSN